MDLPTTAPHPGPVPADWVPVDACTLPTSEQPLRIAEFDDLFATALRRVEQPPAEQPGVRLVLSGNEDLPARVQRLADAETACCSFFTFTLTELERGAGVRTVGLDVGVPAAFSDVLDALVRRAEQARRAES